MSRLTLVLLAVCLGTALSFQAKTTTAPPAQGKLWALLVAGSNYYYNYRHQSDICHAYQILHAHGIPDENIIVMMYDDIANDPQNPTKGVIINHPNGKDVYKGVLKDYTGSTVTPENFINIMTGNKDAMKGIGSGRVIESGPNDHVFVNFVDHGATGILGFPDGELTVKQLNDALTKMHTEKRYQKLVVYVEACEAGSMFRDVLPNNINIFATTASDYDESSYACYYDATRQAYLGDWYSVNWMEDSDKQDIEKETLQAQFLVTKNETTTSHAQEYGDLTIGSMDVGQFQGLKEPSSKTILPKVPFAKGASSWEVPLDVLYRRKAAAETPEKQQALQAEIDNLLEKRGYLETIIKKLVSRVASSHEHQESIFAARPHSLSNLNCHHNLIKAFSQNCFNFGQHPYSMKYAYVLANICEHGLGDQQAIQAIQAVCKGIVVNGVIH